MIFWKSITIFSLVIFFVLGGNILGSNVNNYSELKKVFEEIIDGKSIDSIDSLFILETLEDEEIINLVIAYKEHFKKNIELIRDMCDKSKCRIISDKIEGSSYFLYLGFENGKKLEIHFDDIVIINGKARLKDDVKIKII